MAWGTGARERTSDPKWRRLRSRILNRDFNRCFCGAAATDVDHIKPVAEGGTDDESNLRAICAYHHAHKSAQEGARAKNAKYNARRKPEKHPGLM